MLISEGFEGLTAVLLKTQAYWNVMPRQTINTDVSKDCVASIFRAKRSKNVERWTSNAKALRPFETLATICEPTRRKAVLRQLVRLTKTKYTYWPLLSVSHWLSVIVTKVRENTVTTSKVEACCLTRRQWRVCVWAMITGYLSARRLNNLCQTHENAVTMSRQTFATCNQVRPFV